MTAAKSVQLKYAAADFESDQQWLWLNCHFVIKYYYQIYLNQILEMYTCAGLIIYKSNFILLNISYPNEHLECGQNGAATAIPTALQRAGVIPTQSALHFTPWQTCSFRHKFDFPGTHSSHAAIRRKD